MLSKSKHRGLTEMLKTYIVHCTLHDTESVRNHRDSKEPTFECLLLSKLLPMAGMEMNDFIGCGGK